MPDWLANHDSIALHLYRQVEATIGAFLAFLIGLVFAALGADVAFLSYGQREFYFVLPIYLFLLAAECGFLYYLKVALENPDYPFAPWYAATRMRWPILLRPIIGVWWFAHLAIGVGGAIILQGMLCSTVFPDQTPLSRLFVFAIISMTAAYSANLYLLLAISALGFNQRVLLIAWRWRLLVDLAIAAAAGWGVHHLLGK